MIFGLTLSINSTSACLTRIFTFFLYTCKVKRALGIRPAFGLRCWKNYHASRIYSCKMFPNKLFNFTESCLNVGWVLTWTAVGCRRSDVTIRTSTNRLMIYDLAIRVSTTRIPNDARVDTLTIFACIIKRAVVINIASNRKLGWGW